MTEIYYVEDDVSIAQSVKEYLEQKNMSVTVFQTISGAQQILKDHTPDLLLVDWNMPDGQGDVFCQWIRFRWEFLPLIFLTVRGYMLVTGALCGLLALIGIANVFSNTLGFLRQRKREFARYESVGMTPAGLRKMFFVEALVTAGRPVAITVPLTVVFVGLMIWASSLELSEFLAEAPVLPVVIFMLAIFGFVALAYYIGGKKVMKCSLAEALRDDMAD